MRVFILSFILVMAILSSHAEQLSFAGLKANEVIVIGYRSSGCFHYVERKYVVHGGDRALFEVHELKSQGREQLKEFGGPDRLTGETPITERERLGLDYYLFYLRGARPNGCTTVDQITFGYYRNDVKIGEEQFTDGSCGLSGIYFSPAEGKLVFSADRIPAGLSPVQYQALMPPWLIEMRVMRKLEGATSH